MLTILGILTVLGSVWYNFGWKCFLPVILIAFAAYFIVRKWKWFYVAINTAPRDVRALYGYIRLLMQVKLWLRRDKTLSDILHENVIKHPHKPAILFEDQIWDFAQLEKFSNKVANVFKNNGYKKGDVVALFMENRPEYIAIWLGLSKLGIIVPLINTNQRFGSLLHSINTVKSQALVVSSDLVEAISEIGDEFSSEVTVYQIFCKIKVDKKFHNLDILLKNSSKIPPVLTEKLNHHDCLIYIYTSGTTGLPKAAVISNSRYMFIAAAIHWLAGFRSSDRFYTPLPLYHTAGGCMSVGQMLIYGATIIIRKKFSASSYFPECAKYKCTIAQYIGEMCRYILAVPKQHSEGQHSLRMIYGNGLRPQIWSKFVERFNIPKVAEFYGATEGNANIVNIDNTIGAIGFVSRIIPAVYPISIIRCEEYTGDPIRNAKGLCIPCQPNEAGVFIGKIVPNNPSRAFLGYVNEEATKKKVVSDVFKKGDMAFLSGDILVADEFGYLFFKDRTGDTFRWKGENVSTTEIEAVLSNILAYKDVVVYGVEIKGQEGKAGMAAIFDPDDKVDLVLLAKRTQKALAFYARPIFIRILKQLDLTGTYKLKKIDLQREAFNVNTINDNIYFLDNTGCYTLLSAEVFEKINNGLMRI